MQNHKHDHNILDNAHSFHVHSLKMIFTEKDTWYYIMHLVLCCAYQRKPTIVYPNLWKHFLNICPPANIAQTCLAHSVDTPEINQINQAASWYFDFHMFPLLDIDILMSSCPFNSPSVPLAVRKTLRIVFLTHVSSFQKFLLCHAGSKQKWYPIPILSDTKRASSRSLRKRVQLPLLWKAASKSSYALINLRAQLCMQQT